MLRRTILNDTIMKKMILPLFALLLLSFSTSTNASLTEAERELAVKHLTASRDHLATVLEGLTEAQLNFKASPEAWSIAECAEHIAISENAAGGMLEKTLGTPATDEMRASAQMKDDQIYGIIIDRSQKVKTSKPFEPSGKFGTHEGAVSSFMEKREGHIKYIKSTEDALRDHYNSDLPFGTLDAFQLVLFAAGHTERHVLQMEEVMANENFPKSE